MPASATARALSVERRLDVRGLATALLVVLLVLAGQAASLIPSVDPFAGSRGSAPEAGAAQASPQVPAVFETNVGQAAAPGFDYLLRAGSLSASLSPTRTLLALPRGRSHQDVLGISLRGANPQARMEALDRQPGTVNYLIGHRENWHTSVPTFGRLAARSVYPGVDMVWHLTNGRLEYDLDLAPGADVRIISLALEGAREVAVTPNGGLRVVVGRSTFRFRAPNAFQAAGGHRTSVDARYVVHGHSVGFELGAYDRTRPLVIDPVIQTSWDFGGVSDDKVTGLARGADGRLYVVGTTMSSDLPTTAGAYQTTLVGGGDAFVGKLNAAKTSFTYLTYLGGSEAADVGYGIGVDGSGNAIVSGQTVSTDFPTTSNPAQATNQGNWDRFVAKLNANGNGLVYSTYLGGTGAELQGNEGSLVGADFAGNPVAVDANGNAWIVGQTFSTDFPVTDSSSNPGGADAFVVKLSPTGARLFSRYLGGMYNDAALAAAIDPSTNKLLVSGNTGSPDFPLVGNNWQPEHPADPDAFVARFATTNGALEYTAYLGGAGAEDGVAVAAGPSGTIYVAGNTTSANFPVTVGAFDTTCDAGGSVSSLCTDTAETVIVDDGFVAKMTTTGITYATYLGGEGSDYVTALAVDSAGAAYVTGETRTTNFPTLDAVQPDCETSLGNCNDSFVTKVASTGSSLGWSTYLGGEYEEEALGLVLQTSGNVDVGGVTSSQNFPVTAESTQVGTSDNGFVTELSGAVPSLAACGAGWSDASPFVGAAQFQTADALSSTDVWAAGRLYRYLGFGESTAAVNVRHFVGGQWRTPPVQPGISGIVFPTGISARSDTDVWLVGNYDQGAWTTHWDGSAWDSPILPNLSHAALLGISASPAPGTKAWAVGSYREEFVGQKPRIVRWNGTDWVDLTLPSGLNGAELAAVTALSDTNVWAVGTLPVIGGVQSVILHSTNGTSWTRVPSPDGVQLQAIEAVSPTDIWAGGSDLVHWNGTAWSTVPSPAAGGFGAVRSIAANTTNDAWADLYGTLAHWNGTSWAAGAPPVALGAGDLTTLASAGGTVWGLGFSVGADPNRLRQAAWRTCVAPTGTSTLSVALSGAGAGQVEATPAAFPACSASCSGEYVNGTSVSLSAYAMSAGSIFAGWGGACSSFGAAESCTVSMSQARSVTASFAQRPRSSLTITVQGDGGVGVYTAEFSPGCTPTDSPCTYQVLQGEQVDLSPFGFENDTFQHWGGFCSGTDPSGCSFTMPTTATSVTATFTNNATRTLNMFKSPGNGGTVTSSPSGISCGRSCDNVSHGFTKGAAVTLTATPASGFNFIGWSGDTCETGTGTTCGYTMNDDHTVTANFLAKNTKTLTVTKPTGGSVTSDPAGIDCGTSCVADFGTNLVANLTAHPAAGFTFGSWVGQSGCNTPTCGVFMDSDKTVSVKFVKRQPDAMIKRSVDSAFIGNGVYSSTAAGEVASWSAARGTARSFDLKFQNDGTGSDTYKLKGDASSGGVTVTYLDAGGANVTSAVTGGTYSTGALAPGASVTLRVVIKPGSSASVGSTKAVLVKATSKALTSRVDAVKASLKIS
jgi:Divergent InlB B-repeat domain/Beta-propeller repeat